MTDVQATQAAPAATPVSTITIQGLAFEVDRPYKAGAATLTDGEAHALNQTRAENLRNNFASNVRKAIEDYRKANNLAEDAEVPVSELDHDGLQAEFDKYAESYKFAPGQGGGARTPMDPVMREANRIATEKIKIALAAKSIKFNSVSKDRMSEMVAQVIAKYPDIKSEAERRVKAAGDISLDQLGV